jgi:hypothetical protein
MKKDLLVIGHIFGDETTMPTLRQQTLENKGKKTKTNYMWTYNGYSGEGKKSPIVIYDFTEGRDGKYPEEFLKGFKGYVQVDAYAGYNGLFTGVDGHPANCTCVGFRVGRDVTIPTPHRSGRARLTHPVLHNVGLLALVY